jgi:hypothetical protein
MKKKGIVLIVLVFFVFVLASCFKRSPQLIDSSRQDHSALTALLQKHVDEQGLVNYKALQSDRKLLQNYLQSLSKTVPAKNWSKEEKLAYWINAYNAFTLELILEHYPLASIKDIGASIKIPFVNTPWQIDFIQIGEEKFNLDDIEHGIIRKEFNEPRIHFALVCAAVSCPKLRNEAYEADLLDEQLQDQALSFLFDKEKNDVTSDPIQLSKLFQWFSGDFKKESKNIIDYLNTILPEPLPKNTKISYKEYYWELNEQKN